MEQKTPLSLIKTRFGSLSSLFRWHLLGYGLCRAWIVENMSFARSSAIPGNGDSAVLSLVFALAISALLCMLFLNRTSSQVSQTSRGYPLFLIASFSGLIGTGLVFTGCFEQSLFYCIVGEILIGLCGGFFEICWCLHFIGIGKDTSYCNLLFAVMASAICGFTCNALFSGALFCVASLVLLGGTITLFPLDPWMSISFKTDQHIQLSSAVPPNHKPREILRAAVTCFVFCLVHMSAITLGYNDFDNAIVYGSRRLANFLTVITLLVLFAAKGPINPISLLKTIIPLTALGLFMQLSDVESVRTAALVVLCISNKLFDIFILAFVIDQVEKSKLQPYIGFGVVVLTKNLACGSGILVCTAVIHLVNQGTLDLTLFVFALTLLIIVTLLWMFPEKTLLTTTAGDPYKTQGSKPEGNLESRITFIATSHELTARETEVFALLCRGKNRSSIADELSISRSTAHAHITRIYQKLGVHDQQELIYMLDE